MPNVTDPALTGLSTKRKREVLTARKTQLEERLFEALLNRDSLALSEVGPDEQDAHDDQMAEQERLIANTRASIALHNEELAALSRKPAAIKETG